MTAEELRIVESSKEDRRDDARRCRLAAFGAALRNRCYDTNEGYKSDALERALRAILNTPSLVGPLEDYEIEFFTDWLGRAYRSKSRLLGFGDDKIPVASDSFCLHAEDKSPKFELGNRPLPGENPLPKGRIFEESVNEPDDFLRPEQSEDGDVLDVELMQEINYKHLGELADDNPVRKKRESNHDDENEPKRKRQRNTVTQSPPTDRRRKDGIDAEIYQKDLKHNLQKIASRGRPPNVIRLQVVVKVGGKQFVPHDGGPGVVTVVKGDEDFDWSRIELKDALSPQLEFLQELGIESTREFMTCPILPMAEKLVEYRKERGLPELKGRSILDGASKTISLWRSRVRSFATKNGCDSSFKPSNGGHVANESSDATKLGNEEIDDSGKSDTNVEDREPGKGTSVDKEVREIVAESDAKIDSHMSQVHASSSEASGGDIPTTSKKRKRESIEVDARQTMSNENEEDFDDAVRAIMGETEKEFLKFAGVLDAQRLLQASPTKLGRKYSSWREKNNLTSYTRRSASTQVSLWKRMLRDHLASRDGMSDDIGSTAVSDDSKSNLVKNMIENAEDGKSAKIEGDDAKSPHRKKRRGKRKQFSPDDLLSFLPEIACEFLREQNIFNAESFLQVQTSSLSGDFILWREKKTLPRLRGTGASATISSWKARVRRAAENIGDLDLAELNRERRRYGATKKEEANDRCMFCNDFGDLLICDGCERSCHPSCLDPPLVEIPEGEFYCPECQNTACKDEIAEDDNDICMICGEGGDLVICDGCEKSCHLHCLKPPMIKVPEGDFYCPECSKKTTKDDIPVNVDNDECMLCGDGGDLIICDGCEKSFHCQCLDPPLQEIPEGEFFCPTCSSKPAAVKHADDTGKKELIEGPNMRIYLSKVDTKRVLPSKSEVLEMRKKKNDSSKVGLENTGEDQSDEPSKKPENEGTLWELKGEEPREPVAEQNHEATPTTPSTSNNASRNDSSRKESSTSSQIKEDISQTERANKEGGSDGIPESESDEDIII
jgi:PHD-finger